MGNSKVRIGFVSTRFAGKDGVSLEVEKWVSVLEGMGHECFNASITRSPIWSARWRRC